MANQISGSTIMPGTTWTYSGMLVDAEKGERPAKTPKELIATRAIQMKAGWVGQIIMSGEIVSETEPFQDTDDEEGSELALTAVNQQILDAFRKLIVG